MQSLVKKEEQTAPPNMIRLSSSVLIEDTDRKMKRCQRTLLVMMDLSNLELVTPAELFLRSLTHKSNRAKKVTQTSAQLS